MPIATRTYPADLSPPITQAALFASFRDALSAVFGVAPLKSYTATDMFAVWQLVGDASKTFGRAFYRLRVTAGLVVYHNLASGFTDATNTLINPSGDLHLITYNANLAVKMLGFSTAEYKFLSINQGAIYQMLGYFRPPDAPAWEESAYPRFFVSNAADLSLCFCTALTPYSSSSFATSLNNPNMGTVDSVLQLRSQIQGFWLWGPSNSGIVAQTSADLVQGACTGLSREDGFRVPGTNPPEEYFIPRPGAGALMIRI
jgi:hypothetical protein